MRARRGEHQLCKAVLQGFCSFHILLLLLLLRLPLLLNPLLPSIHTYPDGDGDEEAQEHPEKESTRGYLGRQIYIE